MNSRPQHSSFLSKRVLEEAWIRLLGLYGRSFEAQYGGIDGEQLNLWHAGLCSNEVTDEMVRAATQAVETEHARRTNHPPNFADFLRLCTTSTANNTLSEDRAFTEANTAARTWDSHAWSSPAVYHAAIAVGSWPLRNFPEKVTRPKFVEAFRALLEQERAGQVLAPAPSRPSRDPPPQLPEPAAPATLIARRQRMAMLSSALRELPDPLRRLATNAIMDARLLTVDQLLPKGVDISLASRAVLLKFCCSVSADSEGHPDDPEFLPPSL